MITIFSLIYNLRKWAFFVGGGCVVFGARHARLTRCHGRFLRIYIQLLWISESRIIQFY